MTTAKTFKYPYLIQRIDLGHIASAKYPLNAPWGESTDEKLTQGWSTKADLKKWLSHDYMGSSEFEWGAIPAAWQRMYAAHRAGTLIKFFMMVGTYQVLVITDNKAYAERVVNGAASEDKEFRTKESIRFKTALSDPLDLFTRTVGWFVVDERNAPTVFWTISKSLGDNMIALTGAK